MQVQLSGARPHADLLGLPWDRPLLRWEDPRLVRMVRGPARHVVRFVELGPHVLAIKETPDGDARREYQMLRVLAEEELPAVEAVGVVTGRSTPEGEPLDGAVVTRYLDFALPYTYLLAREHGLEHRRRLIDAAAVLLVRLHLDGMWWGDCSLANMLFRRDAGALAAYLVDAETAEHHQALPDRLRVADVEIAMENVAGGMGDLVAAGRVPATTDPAAVAARLERRYCQLWDELTVEEEYAADERWRLDERVARLNRLGFDAGELEVRAVDGNRRIRIRPSVVEEGHHARKLVRLTGIDVQENQARRLLNDLTAFGAREERRLGRPLSEGEAAHRWLTECFEPFVAAVPVELRGRLEPAEAYHQYLDHRWYSSEQSGRDVPFDEALASFVDEVLRARPDERVVLPTGEVEAVDPPPVAPPAAVPTRQGPAARKGTRSGPGGTAPM